MGETGFRVPGFYSWHDKISKSSPNHIYAASTWTGVVLNAHRESYASMLPSNSSMQAEEKPEPALECWDLWSQ
jgi:hypothetical protein